jgi:uncharacterized protein
MVKRVILVHGWEGSPKSDWFPWMKQALLKKGVDVVVPEMPDSVAPKINAWVFKLAEVVGKVDENTYFVGHSIGCQTILRYFETLDSSVKAGGVLLVAPWVTLIEDDSWYGPDEKRIAKPWIETPINWQKVKQYSKFTLLYSTNDPCVPLSDSKIFKPKLGAKLITVDGLYHFDGDQGITELPVAFDEIMKLM